MSLTVKLECDHCGRVETLRYHYQPKLSALPPGWVEEPAVMRGGRRITVLMCPDCLTKQEA